LHFQIDHLLAILFASVILGLVYEKKMNIYLNMLLHFAFNTFSLLSLFLIKNNVIEENSLELILNYGLIPVGLVCLMLSIKKNNLNLI
ncbi:MAG: CPBP family glutamic-type intramembrane protease, partial [Bacteroidota bacterium]|nr:CPBP family glutamic-type intramembrane protease [Bacteroidota bacterium]